MFCIEKLIPFSGHCYGLRRVQYRADAEKLVGLRDVEREKLGFVRPCGIGFSRGRVSALNSHENIYDVPDA